MESLRFPGPEWCRVVAIMEREKRALTPPQNSVPALVISHLTSFSDVGMTLRHALIGA